MPSSFPANVSGFILLRHGQSEANVRHLIASNPATATEAFGLTDAGRAQVRASLNSARASGMFPPDCVVVSSPLLRARESAEIAAEMLETTVTIDHRLSERGFGEFELTSDEHYERVWSADRADPAHEQWGVESVSALLGRVGALVRELRETSGSRTFILCTHGDVASVLLCAAGGRELTRHREVGAMANGEVRLLA